MGREGCLSHVVPDPAGSKSLQQERQRAASSSSAHFACWGRDEGIVIPRCPLFQVSNFPISGTSRVRWDLSDKTNMEDVCVELAKHVVHGRESYERIKHGSSLDMVFLKMMENFFYGNSLARRRPVFHAKKLALN